MRSDLGVAEPLAIAGGSLAPRRPPARGMAKRIAVAGTLLAILALPAQAGPDAQPVQLTPFDRTGSSSGEAGAPSATVPEPEDYRMTDFRSPVPATLKGASVVDTAAAERLWRSGARFVDVLPRPPRPKLPAGTLWRPPPREHIPGSLWLVNTGFGALSPEAETYFLAALDAASGGDTATPLVFYCQADCWMSWNAARRALAAGYRSVHWYPLGTDGWTAAGLPLEPAEPEPGAPQH